MVGLPYSIAIAMYEIISLVHENNLGSYTLVVKI